MSKLKMIRSVIREYGASWLINRALYSAKLSIMRAFPIMESCFEKKTQYPRKLDIFEINIDCLRVFLQNKLNEEDKTLLVKDADNACRGSILGFSSVQLDYGNPIDWQLNPVTGKRCDAKKKWYQIADFETERGDIKVICEASRFSHFILLARAYLLTNNIKYYKAFSQQLNDWLEKNPYGYGANYKCSQECSLRMINGLLAFTVFRNAGITSDSDTNRIKDLVDRCYRKILSNFFYAYRCVKNNHTISELMGMIVGAWCVGDKGQLKKAYNLLDEVIEEQFMPDGGYRQLSFNYQRLALQDIEVIMSIEGKTGEKLSGKSREIIKKSSWLMFQCQDLNGDLPNYGNNDGALVFPVTSCSYRDFRPTINSVYALTTGNQLYDSGKYEEELLWFSSGSHLDEFQRKKEERISSKFIDAGLFTIRGRRSWAMLVSNDFSSRPGHMDQQHFDLWIDGINVFCDTGTYSYATVEGRRLTRNESHNTVVVEGKTQMNSSGPFLIYDWTKRKLGKCDDSSYEGKTISVNGYVHNRKVKQIGDTYEIIDSCNKDYCVCFHTPCKVEINGKCCILKHKNKELCKVECNGDIVQNKSERSLFYLKKDVITCLVIKGRGGTYIKTTIKITEGE